MDTEIAESFAALERYVRPIMGADEYSRLSKRENTVLALQAINRINLRIGRLSRANKDESLRLLQTYVNSATIAIKNENTVMLRSAMISLRSFLEEDKKPA